MLTKYQILGRGQKGGKSQRTQHVYMAIDLLGRYDFCNIYIYISCYMHVLGNVYEYPCSIHTSFLAMGGKTNCTTRVAANGGVVVQDI